MSRTQNDESAEGGLDASGAQRLRETIREADGVATWIHDKTLETQYKDMAEQAANATASAASEAQQLEAVPEAEKHPDLIPIMDFDIGELMGRRSAELLPAERAAKMLHLVNEQVDQMDGMVQNILATSEQDFLIAYRGQMAAVHKQLAGFKKKINDQKFEMKKDSKLRSLVAEVEYFQNEALHFRELDKQASKHIKEVRVENLNLQDDTYILRRALLNTKVRQKAIERQLEESKAENLDLVRTVQSLNLQLRQLMISNQKKDLINQANGLMPVSSPIASLPTQQSERDRVYNIQTAHDQPAISLATSVITDTATAKASSAADEQGIRAFLYNLINSQHLFTQTDIVDQIEAFIQVKMDKGSQLADGLRDRLARSQAETKKALAAQHHVQADGNGVQHIFKQCLEQLRADKRTEAQRQMYNNPRLLDESNRTERSTKSPLAYAQRPRIPPAHRRLQSGGPRPQKLSLRTSNPSKGIAAVQPREAKPPSGMASDGHQQTADDTVSTVSGTLGAGNLTYTQPLVGPQTTRNMKTRNSAAATHHFRTHTLDAQDKEKGYGSLGNLSWGPLSSDVTTHPRESLKAHEKRALIDSFLKNEDVFQLLYETVFAPTAASAGQVTASAVRKSDSNVDMEGRPIDRAVVQQLSSANDDFLRAVIAGTKRRDRYGKHRAGRASTPPAQGAFFQEAEAGRDIDERQLTIPQDIHAGEDQTFFVTLQEALPGRKPKAPGSGQRDVDESALETLRNSEQDVQKFEEQLGQAERESPAQLAIKAAADEEDCGDEGERLNESREVQDEVNQLGFGDHVFASPGGESKGNLNVQSLLDQQKAGRRKPVRPQSSRPAFRPQAFMTIDPATKFGSRRELQGQLGGAGRRVSGVASDQDAGEDQVQVGDPSSALKSGQTLDVGRLVGASRGGLLADRVPIPQPSLMKGKSEYAYHLQRAERQGQVSQKAIKAHRLSPRSSRLLASTHFMNRNSTANSTLFHNRIVSGTSQTGSGARPAAHSGIHTASDHTGRAGSARGGRPARPFSSKVPKGIPPGANFKQQRQRLASARVRSNLNQRGGAGAHALPSHLLSSGPDQQLVLIPAVLSAASGHSLNLDIHK